MAKQTISSKSADALQSKNKRGGSTRSVTYPTEDLGIYLVRNAGSDHFANSALVRTAKARKLQFKTLPQDIPSAYFAFYLSIAALFQCAILPHSPLIIDTIKIQQLQNCNLESNSGYRRCMS